MQPDRLFPIEPSAKLALVPAEPLPEIFTVTTPAKHFYEVARQEKQEADGPKQVVDESHHSIADCPLRIVECQAIETEPRSLRTFSAESHSKSLWPEAVRSAISPTQTSHPVSTAWAEFHY